MVFINLCRFDIYRYIYLATCETIIQSKVPGLSLSLGLRYRV